MKNDYLRLFAIMLFLFLIGLAIRVVLDGFSEETLRSFVSNLSPEFAGTAITYLLISRLIEKQQKDLEKREKEYDKQNRFEKDQRDMVVELRYGKDATTKQAIIEKMRHDELFAGVKLDRCDQLRGCTFESARFVSRRDAKTGIMVRVELRESDFSEVQFQNCLFEDADFYLIDFTRCVFRNCIFINCNVILSKFTDTVFEQVEFVQCVVEGNEQDKLDMRNIQFANLSFTEVHFRNVTFKYMRPIHPFNHNQSKLSLFFNACIFSKVWFDKAELSGASFRGTRLVGPVSFSDAIYSIYTVLPDGTNPTDEKRRLQSVFSNYEELQP